MQLILVVGNVDMISQICQMLSFCWKLLSAYFAEKKWLLRTVVTAKCACIRNTNVCLFFQCMHADQVGQLLVLHEKICLNVSVRSCLTVASFHRCCQHDDNYCWQQVVIITVCWQQLWSDARQANFLSQWQYSCRYHFKCLKFSTKVEADVNTKQLSGVRRFAVCNS